MNSTLVDAYVDYIVVDDEARAIITFTFRAYEMKTPM